MLISILIIAILILIFVVIGTNSLSDRIMNLEITLDGIKGKTDKLGTNTYRSSDE